LGKTASRAVINGAVLTAEALSMTLMITAAAKDNNPKNSPLVIGGL